MSDESETTETALVPLTQNELAALIPAGPESLMTPVGAQSAKPEQNNSLSVPYVGFRGAKSTKNTEALDEAGIKVGRDGSGVFYLMDPPTPIRLDPFQLHLLQYSRAFTVVDDNGMPTDAILEPFDGSFEEGFREAIYGVVAVVINGQYVPATLQLRGAQVNALKDAIRLLGDSSRPGRAMDPTALAAGGKGWEAASKVRFPGGRFRVTIWSTADLPKGGGQKFNNGHGAVKPTPGDEVDRLNAWLPTPEKWPGSLVQKVIAINNARFEKVRRLALRSSAGDAVDTTADPIPF